MGTRKQRIEYKCPECDTVSYRLPCQVKKGQTEVYCSKECVSESRRHGSTLVCHWCDSEFYRRFGEQDLGDKVNQFCCRACYREWRAESSSGNSYLKIGERHAHRVIAESIIGRGLTSAEVVHHIDNNKHNNHPSNLVFLESQKLHAHIHFSKSLNVKIEQFSLLNAKDVREPMRWSDLGLDK